MAHKNVKGLFWDKNTCCRQWRTLLSGSTQQGAYFEVLDTDGDYSILFKEKQQYLFFFSFDVVIITIYICNFLHRKTRKKA